MSSNLIGSSQVRYAHIFLRKGNGEMYNPKPISTEGIKLSDDLLALTEMLAENTHDVWAKNRIEEGWKYGEERNDNLKLHPCLIPYSELSESEKEYDRNISMETIKLVIKLGYDIQKKG